MLEIYPLCLRCLSDSADALVICNKYMCAGGGHRRGPRGASATQFLNNKNKCIFNKRKKKTV